MASRHRLHKLQKATYGEPLLASSPGSVELQLGHKELGLMAQLPRLRLMCELELDIPRELIFANGFTH